jgi:hypothetical protein
VQLQLSRVAKAWKAPPLQIPRTAIRFGESENPVAFGLLSCSAAMHSELAAATGPASPTPPATMAMADAEHSPPSASSSLPEPTLSFTLPSLHDGLPLDCRVYHPHSLTASPRAPSWQKHAAIVAHPYAPLGGCYDDPVVDIVASTLLRLGFLVATFNFRFELPYPCLLFFIWPLTVTVQ